MGKAYAESGTVSVTVNFNSAEVYNSSVTTTASATPAQPTEVEELFTFTVDTSVSGSIPLTIAVSGGDLVFSNLLGNYVGAELQDSDNDGNPDIVDGAFVVVTPIVDFYDDLNSNTSSSDGKDNVTIDGVAQSRNATPGSDEEIGDWWYTIPDGSTLACDFQINTAVYDTIPTP